MDLNNSETIRIEEFMFAVQFFIASAGITDIILLFNQLDTTRDGILDLNELGALMPPAGEKSHARKTPMSYRAKHLSVVSP